MRFDLDEVATYHTRPMSEAWTKLRDVDLMADGRVCVDFAIALDELSRVRMQLADRGGLATGQVRFDREPGWPVAEIELAARLVLTCQRCLAPLDWPIASRGRVALVGSGEEAQRAPAELETVLAAEHRVSVRDLVEEELLLALPIVPQHIETGCAPARRARSPRRDGAGEERNRPFERLDELLGRGH